MRPFYFKEHCQVKDSLRQASDQSEQNSVRQASDQSEQLQEARALSLPLDDARDLISPARRFASYPRGRSPFPAGYSQHIGRHLGCLWTKSFTDGHCEFF